ncbi:7385_t:CDS:2, partial [Cetraspora pellucida]
VEDARAVMQVFMKHLDRWEEMQLKTDYKKRKTIKTTSAPCPTLRPSCELSRDYVAINCAIGYISPEKKDSVLIQVLIVDYNETIILGEYVVTTKPVTDVRTIIDGIKPEIYAAEDKSYLSEKPSSFKRASASRMLFQMYKGSEDQLIPVKQKKPRSKRIKTPTSKKSISSQSITQIDTINNMPSSTRTTYFETPTDIIQSMLSLSRTTCFDIAQFTLTRC